MGTNGLKALNARYSKAYSQPCKTCKMELFAELANGWKLTVCRGVSPSPNVKAPLSITPPERSEFKPPSA